MTSNFSEHSRSRIQNWIRNSLVLVNGEKKKTGYHLEINDKVEVQKPNNEDSINLNTPEPIELNIIYEDDDLVVINKPAGLVVHSGAGNKSGTLVNGLLFHFNMLSDVNGSLRPGIVHRLDKDTSGVIIVAKTNFAHVHLSNQFQNREVKKTYSGLTWGSWKQEKGVINESLGRNKKDPTSYKVVGNGKASVTDYSIEEQYRHLALVKFYPKTGRTHQIRVHSAFLGHPIFGDEKYGGGQSKTKGFLPELTNLYRKQINIIGRHALHASKIEIIHPKKNKAMIFEAPMPKELLNLVASIKMYYE